MMIAEVLRMESDRSLGARPLRRAFERLVEGPLASEIVAGGANNTVETDDTHGRELSASFTAKF